MSQNIWDFNEISILLVGPRLAISGFDAVFKRPINKEKIMKTNLSVLMLIMYFTTSIFAQEVTKEDEKTSTEPKAKEEKSTEIVSDTQTYQPLEEGYVPFKGDVSYSGSYSYSSSGSYVPNQSSTQSCLTLLRQQEGGGYLDSEAAIKKSANSQTKTGVIVGSSMAVAAGVGTGLLTANPLIGAATGGAYLLVTAIGTEMEKAKIKKNGNTLSASEKLLTGQQLSKKESKAFEKTRKKVSKKTYGNKDVLSTADFAQTVVGQNGIGEKLFCDIDKKGRVRVLAQDRNTIKRLELAQKCKDSTRNSSQTRMIAKKQVTTQR